MIGDRESAGGQYDLLNGIENGHFRRFSDFAQHPYEEGQTGTAGAYQFQYPTWLDAKRRLGLTDFTPDSQDLAAADTFSRYHTTDKLLAGDVFGAILNAGRLWATLPKNKQGDTIEAGGHRDLNDAANDYFLRYLYYPKPVPK